MKIYVSGPVRGNIKGDYEEAAKWIKRQCHQPVISPFIDWSDEMPDEAVEREWRQGMKDGITTLFGCDAIFMIQGWEDSRNARLERIIARALLMPEAYKARYPLFGIAFRDIYHCPPLKVEP